MTHFFLTLICLYTALVAGMYVFQRKLMYMPDKAIEAPEQYGLKGFRDLRTKTADGLSIQLWYRPATQGFPTIVYFHGNASNLANRSGIFSALTNVGFGLLAVSYRGYGKSEGEPSEAGLYADARAGIKFLANDQRIPINQIMLYGESLGTGVAVQMATELPVAGLMLQAPYTSVVNRAAEIYFYVPVRLLIKDHYDSIGKIARVKAPLLIFHGMLDATIPLTHGKTLLDGANEPKHAFFFPSVGHTDFDSSLISVHVLDFARELKLIAQ
jgi:fermentation-respiration switch protein FrsA (DUF1100 family)